MHILYTDTLPLYTHHFYSFRFAVIGHLQHEQKSLRWRDASVFGTSIPIVLERFDPGRAACGRRKSLRAERALHERMRPLTRLILHYVLASCHAASASRLLIGLYPRSPNGVVDLFLAHQLPHVSNHQCMLNPYIHAGFQYLHVTVYTTSLFLQMQFAMQLDLAHKIL